jgi:hypothetical protein
VLRPLGDRPPAVLLTRSLAAIGAARRRPPATHLHDRLGPRPSGRRRDRHPPQRLMRHHWHQRHLLRLRRLRYRNEVCPDGPGGHSRVMTSTTKAPDPHRHAGAGAIIGV